MMQNRNSCFGEIANNVSQEIYQTTRKNKLMEISSRPLSDGVRFTPATAAKQPLSLYSISALAECKLHSGLLLLRLTALCQRLHSVEQNEGMLKQN
jgi:hypothetical protein